MLIGNYLSRLDLKKGRTALPAKFRQNLGNKIIITPGYENTLMIVSKTSWDQVVGKAINKSFLSSASREMDRFLLGSAFELDLDDQGRFILPLSLRKFASLGEEIIFIGVGNRIEIWNKEKWAKHNLYLSKNIEKITKGLDEDRG